MQVMKAYKTKLQENIVLSDYLNESNPDYLIKIYHW